MRLHRAGAGAKGWHLGPWNSGLAIAVGYANEGVDEPHVHAATTEIYLVARGTAELRVERETLTLEAGYVVAVEPGEAHTFLGSSPDYLHFVVQVPQPGERVGADKTAVPRSRLGL